MEEQFKKLEFDQLWEAHFKALLERSRQHVTDIGNSPENLPLNRYLNVTPYDKSRVKLARKADTDYINASYVTVPKAARQYILTQGPLPDTIGDFWLMVWEQKSNVIVMLNKIMETEHFVKCEQYWPTFKRQVKRFDDVDLSLTLDTVKETKHYTVREMTLKDGESGKTRSITQFHYTAWPDHGQPDSPTSLLRLLTAIRKSGGLDKMDEPTIVHCSAGIGRSGTFCLIDSILSMIESQGSTEAIDIDNTLIEMRDYRMGLIQSPTQLRFAYMAIIYGVKILEKANKLYPHISSIKDNASHDNTSQDNTNGFSTSRNNNGAKKSRRGKKVKQSNSNDPSSLNIFKKQLLVETLDDVDSDTAEALIYDAMKFRPNMKKPRNSTPDGSPSKAGSKQPSESDGNQHFLSNAIVTQGTDSVLLRRRERELKNQRIAERTMDIKNRMKAEELKREMFAQRMSLVKKSVIFGGIALVVSSIVYVYLQGNSS